MDASVVAAAIGERLAPGRQDRRNIHLINALFDEYDRICVAHCQNSHEMIPSAVDWLPARMDKTTI
jgi:hypothetical protein